MIERYNSEQLRLMVENPLWYREIQSQRRRREFGAGVLALAQGANPLQRLEQTRERLYEQFEQLLAEQVVALGSGRDWDQERQSVDTIVLHHTGRKPGLTRERLNAMHLLRLYVPIYANPLPSHDIYGTEEAISSGHQRHGQDVFWAYHWLVRSDGEAERLLNDDELGWHAGNWDVNRRSVAICIDDDLMDCAPNGAVLEGIARIMSEQYSDITISPATVLGHSEVTKTDCPGPQFVSGWKMQLLDKLQ